MLNIHQKFCRETFYDGKLVDFKPVYQDNFNFAYDVIDVIAQAEPERRAMLWCNDKGEEHTFTFEGTLVDADGKALGGVSMSIHGNGTQTIVTEDDGSFLLLDMQSGSKTFLVIRNGAVSTMVIEMKEAVNAAKAALSADGKVLTLPSKAKTLSMKLMLNKDNSLSVNSVEVIKWVDGYQPPAGGDDSAETDGSDSGETGPETGVPLP